MKNDSEKLHNLRHSLAHILASAVLEMFPKAQLGVGPVIENGFFYDFLLPRPITPEDLAKIEKRMRALVKEGLAFEREEMSIHEGKTYFNHAVQPFKVELIKDIEKFGTTEMDKILNTDESLKDEQKVSKSEQLTVSLYKTGKFTDLCRGGHVKNTSEIDPQSFKLNKMSGAYWRGDQANPQMQRVYGLAFESKKELDEYIKLQEEAEKRDHKKLGPKLGLFMFHHTAPGMPYWLPKGVALYNELVNFWRTEHNKRNYHEIVSPLLNKKELYQTSGHYEHYCQDMFVVQTKYKAEKTLKDILAKSKKKFTIAEKDGAFYGPKVDILMKDILGREWQMGTIQLDFQQPLRFKLEYTAPDGSKKTPVAIHRVVYGSLERFIGILIEHYAGAFPVWISPVQAKILPISEKQNKYAKEVYEALKESGIRVEFDDRDESVGKKIREAEMEKVPYMLIVGEKEQKAKSVAVRGRNQKDLGVMKLNKFVKQISDEIQDRA